MLLFVSSRWVLLQPSACLSITMAPLSVSVSTITIESSLTVSLDLKPSLISQVSLTLVESFAILQLSLPLEAFLISQTSLTFLEPSLTFEISMIVETLSWVI